MQQWVSVLVNHKQNSIGYLPQKEFSFLAAIYELLKEGFTVYQSNLLFHYSVKEMTYSFKDFSIISIKRMKGFFILTSAGNLFQVKQKEINH